MINIQSETLIQFRDVPAWTKKNLGNRVSPSTIQRWRLRGARGVKLESILAGGTRYTSVEALNRFFNASTAAAEGGAVKAADAAGGKAPERISASQAYLESQGV